MSAWNETTGREQLIERWQTVFEHAPPPRVHTGLLRRVLAWQAQAEASGFKQLAAKPLPVPQASAAPQLQPGTRLLREWRNTTHEVLVLPQGFEYAGKTYTSLSAIARAITGTPWSGPAFFGIKR